MKKQLFFGVVAAFAGGAQADQFHYRNPLIGDRAVGFGRAYVVMPDDTSGLFHNPAGVVYSRQLASATVKMLSRSNTTFDGFLRDGDLLREYKAGVYFSASNGQAISARRERWMPRAGASSCSLAPRSETRQPSAQACQQQ